MGALPISLPDLDPHPQPRIRFSPVFHHENAPPQCPTHSTKSASATASATTSTELFTWGPRPNGAAQRFAELREQHDDKMEVIAQLVEYYEEGAWQEADAELTQAVQSAVPAR